MVSTRSLTTLLAALAFQAASAPAAAVSFAPPFGDHMVLQRDQPLRLWGTAAAGAGVSVSVADRTATGTADADGRWHLTLPPLPAGGPFEVVATAAGGGGTAKLADVLLGDVWLCSGQSNMQFALRNATGAPDAIAAAVADRRLRLMTVPTVPSAVPTDQLDARWAAPTEAATADFSAVAIHFAVALHRSSPALADVPIGLVNDSLGGSFVEYWIPAEPAQPRGPAKPVSPWVVKPTDLYNGMIAPLAGLNLKGVLWYQGESNAGRPGQYAALLRRMIAAWRKDFENPALPFYVVQLPPYADAVDGYSFAGVREAEAQVAAADPNVHLAVTLGTPDGFVLHPRHKQLVGDRLALLARRYAYGQDVVADGPTFRAATPQGSSMRVTFDTHDSPLAAAADGPSDFELAGADGVYRAATAKLDGPDAVLVHSDAVDAPATVRYAWSAAPGATLADAAGLPAGPFRTDDAPIGPTMELQPAKPARRFVTRRYTATVDSASGWLTGLMVDGHQMLSPNLQGGIVPLSGFGPYPLPYCTPIGPAAIAFDDGHLRFTYRFDADAVHLDVRNGNDGGEVPVRCLLAGDVTRDAPFAAGRPTAFAFRRTGLTVEGADSCQTSSDAGYDLQLKVPAGQTRTLTLRLATKPHV